ncbi:hypothetical protein ANN_10297 [Periplaneta americana]|uniref:Uncharacterized protein n=1 Tax=Periplaneta americana TaxID=6978 RepID=A0ABQ8TPP7_PERAM|nr:hypothetical protein ANN_10297 [Periplaneta americana]
MSYYTDKMKRFGKSVTISEGEAWSHPIKQKGCKALKVQTQFPLNHHLGLNHADLRTCEWRWENDGRSTTSPSLELGMQLLVSKLAAHNPEKLQGLQLVSRGIDGDVSLWLWMQQIHLYELRTDAIDLKRLQRNFKGRQRDKVYTLGFCRKGELLRNNRHHRVRGAIACLLRNKGWEVHEEVYCISEDDSHRRADIIAINKQQQKAIIIDPTIRMERDLNQAHQVDQEKRAISELVFPTLVPSITSLSSIGQ